MDSIRPLPSVQPVNPASAREQGSSANQSPLDKGQIFKALVTEARRDGTFLLDISGKTLEARSQAPLRTGDLLQLQVLRTTPSIELQIVRESPSQFLGRTLTLVDSTFDLSGLLQSLKAISPSPLSTLPSVTRNLLESFFQLQQQPPDKLQGGENLKQLIENLGLKMEARLATGDTSRTLQTLKAALLEVAQSFGKAENIAESTHRLLTSLEFFQLSQIQISTEHIIFPLPFPFLDQGYLVYDRKESDNSSDHETEHHFSLHLKLQALGNIFIDILQLPETLYIRFQAEDQQRMEFLKGFESLLQESLSIPAQLSFSDGAGDPLQDLATRLLPSDGRSFDAMV